MKKRYGRAVLGTIAVALGAAACASTQTGPSVVSPPTAAEVLENPSGGTTTRIISSDQLVLDAPVEQVWTALTEVYAELGIPVTVVDGATYTLMSSRQRVQRIGGVRVDRYFECWGSYENDATRGQLLIELRSQAAAEGAGHTIVQTAASSVVRPANSTNTKLCPGNGKLQQVIGKRLQEKLALAKKS